jgi:hypothetical protein
METQLKELILCMALIDMDSMITSFSTKRTIQDTLEYSRYSTIIWGRVK